MLDDILEEIADFVNPHASPIIDWMLKNWYWIILGAVGAVWYFVKYA